ncbi:MAG: hypothetical protein Q8L02_00360 [Candidatus Nitrotoga sp.]|nr:hypothetical protein [Candidatus Nitrotoga sp.]
MTIPMPVYQKPISSKVQDVESIIPLGTLAYFRGRFSNKIHELVLEKFAALEREEKMNRAELARKIRRKPEQITRWLGSPGNWTLDTLSDLLLGMGMEPEVSVRSLASGGITKSMQHASWTLPNFLVDVQTPQQVTQDIADGNHKHLYFSFRMIDDQNLSMNTIETKSLPTPSQPTTITIAHKETVHANQ